MTQTNAKKWANYLQERIDRAQPWGLTFYNSWCSNEFDEVGAPKRPTEPITDTQRAELEAHLERRFRLWADSWIQPIIDEMLGKKEMIV